MATSSPQRQRSDQGAIPAHWPRRLSPRRFAKEFAYTPIGTVQPNGQHVQWELINIFRYTDDGRLAEWAQSPRGQGSFRNTRLGGFFDRCRYGSGK